MFEQQILEQADISQEILQDCKNELFVNLRFLDVALHRLSLLPTMEVGRGETEGEAYYYNPVYLIEQYRAGAVQVNRIYLHTVLHCLFGHIWNRTGTERADLWDLACDIAVEYIIDSLYCRCLRNPSNHFRRAAYQGLLEKIPVIHAEALYRRLSRADLDVRLQARLIQEFQVDGHGRWPCRNADQGAGAAMEQQNQWKDIREKTQTQMETFSKEAAEGSKDLKEQLMIENRQRYDYRTFLRKFCVIKEEMQVDLDSFDYIFYHYGMELYGNMPLIEPQETKEVQRVQDLVIVIDTSMSCKARLVQKFLEETYDIVSQSGSFARRFRVHIIQCDEQVRSDVVVENGEQLKAYMEAFQVKGMGGTDFRPAFAYVDRLIAQKAFQKLRGLIYFTDGYGTFPARKPVYDTAFLFFREDYQDVDVPAWAMKLILGEEELTKTEPGTFSRQGECHFQQECQYEYKTDEGRD